MSDPLVSVCMVVCNVDRFLSESIQSILDQTFTDFEFVIVDFGSTDRTKEIVSEFQARDTRIKFHAVPSCGLAEARNAASGFAVGRYIAIMDADDVSIKDRLQWQIEHMEMHPEVGALGGATELIDTNGQPLLIQHYSVEDRRTKKAKYLPFCPLCQPSVLMRRELFVAVGGYREAFAPAEDMDLWMRIAERSELANLEQVVLKYRVHPCQLSQRKVKRQTLCALGAEVASKFRRAGYSDPLDSVREITPEVLSNLGVDEAAQQTALAGQYLAWIRRVSRTGDDSSALNLAIEMFAESNWNLAEAWMIADSHLAMAALYWKKKRWLRSVASATQAILTRPLVAIRPLRNVERWIRSSHEDDGLAAGKR